MIVDKIHEIISFKQSKWSERKIRFKTQKRTMAKNVFEKDFYKLLNNAFYGKTTEIVRNRSRLEFIKNYEYKRIIIEQSELTFAGIQKSFEFSDSYSFKQNEVEMDEPFYLGFVLLGLSKLHMYET